MLHDEDSASGVGHVRYLCIWLVIPDTSQLYRIRHTNESTTAIYRQDTDKIKRQSQKGSIVIFKEEDSFRYADAENTLM